jgi:hypothetical protein
MEKTLVKFTSVYSDRHELKERERLEELNGQAPEAKHDFIAAFTLDVSKVFGYEVGTVDFNSDVLDCIYLMIESDTEYSRNIIGVKPEQMDLILEYHNNTRVTPSGQLIEEIKKQN